MELAAVILFALAFYVGASIVRSIKGHVPPPDPKSKKFNTVKERIE